MPLASEYRDGARLRKALMVAVAAADQWAHVTSELPDTALLLYGFLDEAAALATVRLCVDGPMTRYTPGRGGTHGQWKMFALATAAYALLAHSTDDVDLELFLKGFPQFATDCWLDDGVLFPAAMACREARHPKLDERLLSMFGKCVGEPGDWRSLDDADLVQATFLASLLYARSVEASRDLVEKARKSHPDDRLRQWMKRGAIKWKSAGR